MNHKDNPLYEGLVWKWSSERMWAQLSEILGYAP